MDKILEVKNDKNYSYYVRANSSQLQDTDDEVSIRIMNYGDENVAYFGTVYKQVDKPDGSGTEKRVVINDLVNRAQILRYVASAIGITKEEFRVSLEDYMAWMALEHTEGQDVMVLPQVVEVPRDDMVV